MKKSRIWIISSAPSPILASDPAAFSKIKDFCRDEAEGRDVGEVIKWGTSWWRNWDGGKAARANVSNTNDLISAGVVDLELTRDIEDSRISIGTLPARLSISVTLSGLPSRWAPCNNVTALLKSPSHLSINTCITTVALSCSNLTPSLSQILINLPTPAEVSTGPNRNLAQRLVSGSMILLT